MSSPDKLCFGLSGALLMEVEGVDMPCRCDCSEQGMRQRPAACPTLQHCKEAHSLDVEVVVIITACPPIECSSHCRTMADVCQNLSILTDYTGCTGETWWWYPPPFSNSHHAYMILQ